MESLAKPVNVRVKGMEMSWNDPEGVEAIPRVRAVALRDERRPIKHPCTHQGHPVTRRPKLRKLTAEGTKNREALRGYSE
jgi:hypothetical protein